MRGGEERWGAVRVLAVGAHPDDLEILCGGTLARLAAQGHEVVMCHAARGDRGSFAHGAEEIAAVRLAEATEAAALAGARVQALGFSDGEVYAEDPAQRRQVVDLVRETRPDMVITHHPDDYMSDHTAVSRLVQDATFLATVPLYVTRRAPHDLVAPIYFMDTLMGVGFEPTEYVDIQDHFETKLAMLGAHRSQLRWLADHDGIDMLDAIAVTARFRGLQSGVRHAEGFRQCLRWLRGTTRRLLP